MVKAKGNGQGECYLCKQEGKYSWTWMCFLYETEADNFEHCYCYEHAKQLEENKIKPTLN